jgi:hypothetical protein
MQRRRAESREQKAEAQRGSNHSSRESEGDGEGVVGDVVDGISTTTR